MSHQEHFILDRMRLFQRRQQERSKYNQNGPCLDQSQCASCKRGIGVEVCCSYVVTINSWRSRDRFADPKYIREADNEAFFLRRPSNRILSRKHNMGICSRVISISFQSELDKACNSNGDWRQRARPKCFVPQTTIQYWAVGHFINSDSLLAW